MAAPLIAIATTAVLAKSRTQQRTHTVRQLQRILDGVRSRLGIERAVTVAIVTKNPHVVSVEPPKTPSGPYVVSIEEAVLALLSEEEIEAALAHEVGHVWVFTHHPYLQTERLANEVAMRVVSRDALVRVYEKVWKRDGLKGDFSAFLEE
jgi:hypothetical protein